MTIAMLTRNTIRCAQRLAQGNSLGLFSRECQKNHLCTIAAHSQWANRKKFWVHHRIVVKRSVDCYTERFDSVNEQG